MSPLKNAINWFEIPVANFDRAKEFYQQLFDYEMAEMIIGKARMGLFQADMEQGGIGGAIVFGEGYTPTQSGAKIYLNAGSDMEGLLSKIDGLGGSVKQSKTEIEGGHGYFSVFEDTEGNLLYLHSNE